MAFCTSCVARHIGPDRSSCMRQALGANGETRLVIEPSGGGGDIHVESPRRRIVQQWKSKSDAGAWSLRKIIADVLPDLYRAVDLASAEQETEFHFVTEGHRGKWAAAEQFFATLGGRPSPDDPLAALDDKQLVAFFPGESTHRSRPFRLYPAVAARTRGHRQGSRKGIRQGNFGIS